MFHRQRRAADLLLAREAVVAANRAADEAAEGAEDDDGADDGVDVRREDEAGGVGAADESQRAEREEDRCPGGLRRVDRLAGLGNVSVLAHRLSGDVEEGGDEAEREDGGGEAPGDQPGAHVPACGLTIHGRISIRTGGAEGGLPGEQAAPLPRRPSRSWIAGHASKRSSQASWGVVPPAPANPRSASRKALNPGAFSAFDAPLAPLPRKTPEPWGFSALRRGDRLREVGLGAPPNVLRRWPTSHLGRLYATSQSGERGGAPSPTPP